MTGNGHVRFGGGLSQKYCPDDGRQLGGSLPNLRQAVKAAGDRLTEATTDATKGFLGPKPDIDWQDPAARKAHLGELVAAARMLVAEASAVDDPGFAEATALLAQVVSQDTEVDEAGEAKIRQGVAKDRIISTSDPEMRHGRKSASRKFDGYKMDVMTEEHTELVLGVEIRSGNAGDGEGAAPLLEQVQTIEGIEVEQLLGDMAYSDGDTRVAVEELGAELVAKVPPVATGDCFPRPTSSSTWRRPRPPARPGLPPPMPARPRITRGGPPRCSSSRPRSAPPVRCGSAAPRPSTPAGRLPSACTKPAFRRPGWPRATLRSRLCCAGAPRWSARSTTSRIWAWTRPATGESARQS